MSRTSASDACSGLGDSCKSSQQQHQQPFLRRQFQLSDDVEFRDCEAAGSSDRSASGALLSWLQPLATRPPPLPPASVPHLTFPLSYPSGHGNESETSKVEPVVRSFRAIFSAPPPQCALRLEPFRPVGIGPEIAPPQLGGDSQPLKWANQKLRVVRVKDQFH